MYHIYPHTWRRGARNTVAFLTCIFLTVLPLQLRKRLTYTPSPRVARSNMTSQNPGAKRCRLVSPRCLTFCSNQAQKAIRQGRDFILCALMPYDHPPPRECQLLRLLADPDRCDAGFCGCLTKTFESTASSYSSLNADLLLPLISAEFQDFCLFHAPELGRGLALLGGTRSCYCSPSNKLLVLAYRGD